VACTRCPRLGSIGRILPGKRSARYREWEYWGKACAWVRRSARACSYYGLAPGAHGSNRTGRPFHRGLVGEIHVSRVVVCKLDSPARPLPPTETTGMKLTNLYITAAVRCAPPDNKPLPQELAECSHFSGSRTGWIKRCEGCRRAGEDWFLDAYLNYVKRAVCSQVRKAYIFKHAASYHRMPDG